MQGGELAASQRVGFDGAMRGAHLRQPIRIGHQATRLKFGAMTFKECID